MPPNPLTSRISPHSPVISGDLGQCGPDVIGECEVFERDRGF